MSKTPLLRKVLLIFLLLLSDTLESRTFVMRAEKGIFLYGTACHGCL